MEDILFWTTVVGGTPLMLGLIQLVFERWRDAIRGRSTATESLSWQRWTSESWQRRMHA